MSDQTQLAQTIETLESNAHIQAKLLADTGRQRDDLVNILKAARLYVETCADASIPNPASELLKRIDATLSRIKTEG